MKALTQYVKHIYNFLKKKKDLSFLNAAGVLLVVGVLAIPLPLKYLIDDKINTENEAFLSPVVYRDLTYIKPFTSLVGFNWKFSKENKRKDKELKTSTLVLPILNFWK